ncbi:hypothetical protein F2Q70_00030529 [Brassica cretica]|uniref:Uncharacterized protein n=1 Tax=Brassica cretica TaxID=69181 RepID=A0A8S9FIC3_BRACR|nr:hypothetical protein F2Q70_00030529 [Brassica cretica]
MLTPSAYTGRITYLAVCLTSPLNPMSGVTLRVRVLSSSPRSWYAVWKMMLLELPLSTSILFTKQFDTVREITRASWWGARIFSCSLAVKLISSVPRCRRFGWVVPRPCLALRVLFFAAAWLTPLTSEPPDMTWITRSWRGGEAGTAPLDFPTVSLLRWALAFSERNSRRCPFWSSSLTSILRVMQSSVLWP